VSFTRFLDELAEASYRWFELGPFGYLPTDPGRLADEVGSRGLQVSGGTTFGALHRPADWAQTVATTRRVAELTAAAGAHHLAFIRRCTATRRPVSSLKRRSSPPSNGSPSGAGRRARHDPARRVRRALVLAYACRGPISRRRRRSSVTGRRFAHLQDPQIILFETSSGARIDLEAFVNCQLRLRHPVRNGRRYGHGPAARPGRGLVPQCRPAAGRGGAGLEGTLQRDLRPSSSNGWPHCTTAGPPGPVPGTVTPRPPSATRRPRHCTPARSFP
jgi:hypothetical protein